MRPHFVLRGRRLATLPSAAAPFKPSQAPLPFWPSPLWPSLGGVPSQPRGQQDTKRCSLLGPGGRGGAGRGRGAHVFRKRLVMPCTSCTTSPCRTGLGGLLTSSRCLGRHRLAGPASPAPLATAGRGGRAPRPHAGAVWNCATTQPLCTADKGNAGDTERRRLSRSLLKPGVMLQAHAWSRGPRSYFSCSVIYECHDATRAVMLRNPSPRDALLLNARSARVDTGPLGPRCWARSRAQGCTARPRATALALQ